MVVHPLESSGKRTRSVRGTLPSIAVHAAIVLVAVHATAHAAPGHVAPGPATVHYVPTAPPPAPEHSRPSDRAASSAHVFADRVSVNAKPMTWAITVPDHIPAIDPSATLVIDRSDFGPGVKTRSPFASGAAPDASVPRSAADVERQVSPIGAPPTPVYPEALRSSGTRGSVTAEFVVDTTGRVEPGSFRALSSDSDLFTAAVRAAVLRTRFHPAEAGGRRVRQLVQESFSFVLQ